MFPMYPKTLKHKCGGAIKVIHGMSHKKEKPSGGRSRDYWFWICDVEWSDGHASERFEVAPYQIVADDSTDNNPEIRDTGKAMNDYLYEHGDFNNYGSGSKKPGGWYAHR